MFFHFWKSYGHQIWTAGRQIGEESRRPFSLCSGDIITQWSRDFNKYLYLHFWESYS